MNDPQELDGFQNPYELEYSMSKENENKEIPIISNLENNPESNHIINNNTLDMNKNFQNNDQNNNFQDIGANVQLNKTLKRNKSNNDINPIDILELNKKNNSIKKFNSKKKGLKSCSVNKIGKFSSMNDYWAERDKKNKIKMDQLIMERHHKIYGDIYDKPKLNKNTIEIVKRLKQSYFHLSPEEEIEDQINHNIPIKTLQNNYSNKFYNNNKKNLVDKNIKSSNKNINPQKSKKNKSITTINKKKKISKTPNSQKTVNKLSLKIPKKKTKSKKFFKNNFHLSSADIKGLEKIIKMRREEEIIKLRSLQEQQNNINLINYNNYQPIQTDVNQKESDYIDNNIVTFNQSNKKSRSVLKKNINKKFKKTEENQTKNQLMEIRNQLSIAYDMNKRILNHSYLDDSCPNLQNINNRNKNISSINEYDYYSKKLSENQKNFVYKKNNSPSSSEKVYKNLLIIDNKNIYNSGNLNNTSNNQSNDNNNDTIEKSIDIPENNENNKNNEKMNINSISRSNIINNNKGCLSADNNDYNNFSSRINNLSFFNFINQSKKNNNTDINLYNNEQNNDIIYSHTQHCLKYNNKNINSINQTNNNNSNDNNNSIYLREYKYQINKINDLKNKYNAKDASTKKLLNEAVEIVNNHDEYTNKFLNENTAYINRFIQDVDNETLKKYRIENNAKLQELNEKNFIKEKINDLPISLRNEIKMRDDVIGKINRETYQKINSNKVSNILNNEKQKMENNLDYYNKELKINQQKKEMLLKKMFGNEGNKYCIKKNDIKPISNSEYDFDYYRINSQKIFDYKNRIENKKDDYNEYGENGNMNDILVDFKFQRKHHFS